MTPFLRSCALLVCLALAMSLAHAIDNPDAPDEVAAFEQRAKPLEERFLSQSRTSGIQQAGAAYAQFLDTELNRAYRLLLQRLDAPARARFKQSQRAWLAYRRAETRFIDANWTPAHFGDSYALSRQDYRNTLVKQRVLALLHYLRND